MEVAKYQPKDSTNKKNFWVPVPNTAGYATELFPATEPKDEEDEDIAKGVGETELFYQSLSQWRNNIWWTHLSTYWKMKLELKITLI